MIDVNPYLDPDLPRESFAAAFKRMAQSTLGHIAWHAAIRELEETTAALCVFERSAPWYLRWFPPARRWWDRREARWCQQRRALHGAAARKFAEAVAMARVGEKMLEDEGCPE